MESVKFDDEKNKKQGGEIVNVYNEIINKLNTFFGPNIFEKASINHSEKCWDYYTGINCKKMKPKALNVKNRLNLNIVEYKFYSLLVNMVDYYYIKRIWI